MAHLQRGMLRNLDRTARLHIDLLGPVGVTYLLARSSVPSVRSSTYAKPLRSKCTSDLCILPSTSYVHQHRFIDAVIVPLVERGHLIDPFGLAGIDVAGEDAHGPLVVELAAVAIGLRQRFGASILRRPQTRVAGSVVHQVQCGIVGIPAPRRAAAPLPLIAGIGADAEVLAGFAVFRMMLIGLRRQAHVFVAAGGMALPDHLAVGEVVGGDSAASRELVAAEPDDDFVIGDDRGRSDGFAVAPDRRS